VDFVDRIKAEKLRDIYRYWRGKCRDGALPSRADLDPMDIPALLPHVFLVDIVDGGRDFRYRLLGTHIIDSVGFEYTGQLVSEFMRGREEAMQARDYHTLFESREPQHVIGNLVAFGRDYMRFERVVCPLSSDGGAIDMIFGGLCFQLEREQD
jgi:hypothetical protein